MKKHIEKRTSAENRIFAAFGGLLAGIFISPIGWWAFNVPSWKEGAALSIAFGIVAAAAAAIMRAKSFESFISSVIRILNPP